MTTSAAEPLSMVLAREIRHFVAASARMKGASLYRNRRASVRHHRSCPIFVAQLADDLAKDVSATLRDVSAEGIGFYSEYWFPIDVILGVKLCWTDPSALRVPVCVRQQHETPDGILVGAQFITDDAEVCRLLESCPSTWYG